MSERTAELEQLADEALHLWLSRIPVHATLLGFREYDDQVPDLTVEAEQDTHERLLSLRRRVESVPEAHCDGQDRITRTLILHRVDQHLVELAARTVEFDVGVAFAGAQGIILRTAPKTDLATPDQAEGFLRRVERFGGYLDQAVARLRDGVAAGRTPGIHAVEASLAEIDRHLATPLDEDALVVMEAPAGWDGEPAWRAKLRAVVDTVVRPAMAGYRAFLAESVAPTARPIERAGLRWLPDGEAIYASAVRTHTTTELSAEEIHALGLATVERVERESAALGARLFGTTDVGALFRRLRSDPELRFSSAEEILTSSRETILRAEAEMGAWFGRLPNAPCIVKEIPPLEAVTGPRAYYQEPARDGSRPGTFWANTSAPAEVARFDSEALTFHEAIPGHHLHLALLMEDESLSLFRRLSIATATVEGWGLYAERLAEEMGLYSEDLQRLGMLSLEAMRGCRAVVDTGMHALGWTPAQAVAFITEHSAWPEADIGKEVDRYLAIPGQALSYLVGSLEIRRIRDDAAKRLGATFDLPAFHDELLSHGALPLPVLAAILDAWVDTQREEV